MDVDTLRIFIDVARRGSFAAVARERGLVPSSVSRSLAQLEGELGVRLLQRTTRRLTLTEAGALYLARVEDLADMLDDARNAAHTLNASPAGTLRLTCSVAFGHKCLTPLLPGFRAAFPALKLEMLLSDANLDLVAQRIDLAIRLGPSIDVDVISARLFKTHYRVCASPGYLARITPPLLPGDLTACRCVLFALPEFRSRWLFRDAAGSVTEVPVDGDLVISNALAVRDCALAGLGPALLPHWLIDGDIAAGHLVDLFPTYQVAATSFDTAAWLLYPSRSFLPNKVRVAIDFLTARLRP